MGEKEMLQRRGQKFPPHNHLAPKLACFGAKNILRGQKTKLLLESERKKGAFLSRSSGVIVVAAWRASAANKKREKERLGLECAGQKRDRTKMRRKPSE
jgi:hypothetical protein